MNAVPQLVRQRCKTCQRAFPPCELLAGLCQYCLLDRSNSWDKIASALNGGLKECFECHGALHLGAYLHWDVNAKCFYFLCIPCSVKAIRTAEQYRGTPFGYAHKVE